VIELKTELVDVQDLIGTLDRKRRPAPRVAAERGWVPMVVATWLILAPGRTNRRRVDAHRTVFPAGFPADGRTMQAWLQAPSGPVAALSFWPSTDGTGAGSALAPTVRVPARRRTR
jgi:hypothetical protein